MLCLWARMFLPTNTRDMDPKLYCPHHLCKVWCSDVELHLGPWTLQFCSLQELQWKGHSIFLRLVRAENIWSGVSPASLFATPLRAWLWKNTWFFSALVGTYSFRRKPSSAVAGRVGMLRQWSCSAHSSNVSSPIRMKIWWWGQQQHCTVLCFFSDFDFYLLFV